MVDLAIRGGTLVDGTGAPAVAGIDVLIEDGRIVDVGANLGGKARRELDADGLLVTPGFVDNHTHYDGQATWDDVLAPSVWHGVTTAIMGNCGVGFAPVRTDYHQALIELMEGVEDIPGSALTEGITWNWETFPEYLDALESMSRTIDVGVQVGHAPLRTYVMGERGAANEPANADELAEMARLVTEAIRAGAFGVSSSRTMLHRSLDGSPVPGTFAGADELSALVHGISRGGFGLFEVASDIGVNSSIEDAFSGDIDWMVDLSCQTGVTVTYALLQNDRMPELWRQLLGRTQAARKRGGRVVALTAGRPAGVLLGFGTSLHPFSAHRAFRPLRDLPLPEKLARLRRAEVRQAILTEETRFTSDFGKDLATGFWKMYPLGEIPDYEPSRSDSVQELARAAGIDPAAYIYDFLLGDDGKALAFFPLGDFAHGNLDSTYERLQQPDTVLSLSDGGAHCRLISDASVFTYMLSYWARDRTKGPRLPVERAVQLLTSESARLYGLGDRGVLKPGYRADVNVINHEQLGFRRPEMVADLPAGGERFLQPATGYVATVCAGELTVEHGEVTDARPGGLLRGPRKAPA
jgi:N-acyl-D-aspartate/D-glutamate deacylase